ncbi:MAG: hypothetical protein ACO1N5_17995 [Noviherbaspirillum sp.]
MATREEIAFLREARSGKGAAQLILGRYYLFGGAGLKRNGTSALYWLHRAATRDEREAWQLIGRHIPFEVAASAPDPGRFCIWYERAVDAGVVEAALTWARLLLATGEEALPRKALTALEEAARAGQVEAQWLLAQELNRPVAAQVGRHAQGPVAQAAPGKAVDPAALEWATRAAANGVLQAQRALADRAERMGEVADFLRWGLPVARALVRRQAMPPGAMAADDAAFLARCASHWQRAGDADPQELERFWQLAAGAGNREARFALGLWFANMDEQGQRRTGHARNSNYRKAIHFLTLAGEQGEGAAWYALSRIFMRPNTGLSAHGLADARRYLEHAAQAGHRTAQLELGRVCWRNRRSDLDNDVRAAHWLAKAAAQGAAEAAQLLARIATGAAPAPWAHEASLRMSADAAATFPLLAARIELAARFGLSLPEAMLLDVNAADRGHCLLVDIRALHARSKRRLILVRTGGERLALDRIGQQFTGIDCTPGGPEGNYRQRLYLFRKLFGEPGARGKGE